MEHVMNLPLFLQLQSEGYGGYNLGDFKGAGSLAQSFLEGTWSLRFLVSSQTLSPTF